jgi:Family of unknown function (DUF6527)
MARRQRVTHRFVEQVPSPLEDGVVYVSIGFGTVVHKCCCGCGDKVVTPLTPVDWAVAYNGQSVSLHPSIGRWDAPCRSHYWIRNDRVIWSDHWSQGRVDALKRREAGLRDDYFGLDQERPHKEGDSNKPDQGPGQRGWLG